MAEGHGQIDRIQFLRGRFRGAPPAIRPPWALGETAFLDTCERCESCADACPEGIIGQGSGGFPVVDFAQGECTFCEACAKACPSGALALYATGSPDAKRLPWSHRAEIGERCIARAGVECRVCGEFCETRAIRFRLAVGGAALPEIDNDACTGCGACVAPCPVGAVAVR
jgi:ferredoxin-type protein NapF